MNAYSPFFVTGHPRSRTFWFAQYLSAAGGACGREVVCHHEFLSRCTTRERFYNEMNLPGRGNSDCGLILTDFQSVWPSAPTLIVQRDIDEVVVSLHRLGVTDVWTALKMAQHRLDRLKGLHVPYWEINERLEEIHTYLLPEVPFQQGLADEYVSQTLVRTHFPVNPAAANLWANIPRPD